MASEKAQKILLKKEAPFTIEQIASMREADAWAWIYKHDKELRDAKKATPQICFTGFTITERNALAEIALRVGFEVKDSVTKNLLLLVAGENAGPSKISKADAQGCTVTDAQGFTEYIRSLSNDE